MKLINYLFKKSEKEQIKEQESELEAKFVDLVGKKYKEICKSRFTRTRGTGSSKSVSFQISSWKKELTQEQVDYYFTFVGMEEGGYSRLEKYLLNKKNKVWKYAFVYEDFIEDVKNIYRKKIYKHKFDKMQQGEIWFENYEVAPRVISQIYENKTGFVLNPFETDMLSYMIHNANKVTPLAETVSSHRMIAVTSEEE